LASKVDLATRAERFARLTGEAEKGARGILPKALKARLGIQSSSVELFKRTFLDTNILLYAEDARETRKREIAIQLIVDHRRRRTGVVSLQVLQEFFVNATKKLGLDPAIARHKVEFHSRFDLVQPSMTNVFAAIDLHRLHRIPYWDALIVHCAKQAGCHEVLTEDLQHGQVIDGVRIVNPFL
jgi:predicted nucleic acid-binding protein